MTPQRVNRVRSSRNLVVGHTAEWQEAALRMALCIMNGWGIPKVSCRVATENRMLR